MNELGTVRGCRPLHWSVSFDSLTYRTDCQVAGMAEETLDGPDEVRRILGSWVALFEGAVVFHREADGMLEYRGEVDGWTVVLWGIVDRDAWDATMESMGGS